MTKEIKIDKESSLYKALRKVGFSNTGNREFDVVGEDAYAIAEQHANQRVIEELGNIYELGYEAVDILNVVYDRLKELKEKP